MNFSYHKTAKRRGIEGMLICSLFFLICAAGTLYIVFIKQQPEFLSFLNDIVVWILGFIILILYGTSYRLYKSPYSWNILITDTEVIWESPPVFGEKTFHIQLNEISKVICEESTFSDSSASYYLHLTNGKKITLNSSLSGLNINNFVRGLKKRGIEYVYIKS